ncbi:hypothetical protein NtRootA4_25720 [Arthrobacter sp. NtRootA4]|nr:hypothetical protein NtRootA2_27900 [Arthrobacter sp. NtRootA2]BCW15593.1 hypothetical protein NtRootA4_25720 [Arthrobacter sp. NtRootA4]BCW23927.1 hypothetical protein NtRootC7_27940 [Arthrobacter sp. NtRootC7]BCW28195.1 hypothetical protein NtRootC45_27950 [Arthrobacter sp. NtRootC45]BCW32465.1 hypothetical protein NtRootD5_27960 [Arthrobacter sp. NtRootD5]
MSLGFVFIGIGLVWLAFRKWIARRQYFISSEMLGRKMAASDAAEDPELYEERVRGFEMLGVFFCSVLIVGGLLIVVLTLIFRPPWAGA